MSDWANPFPDSEICEACTLRFPIEQMHLTDDPCWLCDVCFAQTVESQSPMLDDEHDEDEWDGEPFCIECGDTFRYDDCGGYNPPCACGFHCRSCHEAVEGERDDDDYERDETDRCEELERATERFWDGRVGHSANADSDNDELPF